MYSERKKGLSFLLLIFSPILGLFYGLKNLNQKSKRAIFTFFGIIYGLTINFREGNDGWSHVQGLQKYYNLGFGEFFNRFLGILTFNPPEDSPSDLYIHFLFGIAGSVFQSPLLLFGIVGGIYGYFYGSALLKIINFPDKQKISLLIFSLISIFVILRSFESMQTIRSWTGMWVLFNGVLGYYQTKNKKYILFIIFSPFFHLMYVFIALPALILVFFKSIPRKWVILLYFISFFANINTLSVLNLASENQLAESKVNSYYRISDDGEEIDPIALRHEESQAVWYAKYGKTDAVYYGSTYFIFLLILTGLYRGDKMNDVEIGLFFTGVLMAALANFLSFSYAFYSRTMANASVYILAVMVLLAIRGIFNYKNKLSWKNMAVWLGVLIFIPKVVYFASDFLYRTSMSIMAFPFIRFFGEGYNFSIRDFIDQFL